MARASDVEDQIAVHLCSLALVARLTVTTYLPLAMDIWKEAFRANTLLCAHWITDILDEIARPLRRPLC
jgi:hypothetical protein